MVDQQGAGPSASHPDASEKHHRDVQGGSARAAVFGISDGLVTNVSLILGVAGAHPAPGFVRLAGLAGLLSGAFSMAAGEYVSMSAQRELFERELDVERRELKRHPAAERRELVHLYEKRGLDTKVAEELAETMMRDPETALETHAREELGLDPDSLGSPRSAAMSSLAAFALGAVLPLLPWFFTSGTPAILASVVLGAGTALAIGLALAAFTGRSPLRSALRQLVVSAVAAGITFGVGSLIGMHSGA
ncbi:MAG: VIT1/CCC1 transporter family protein [Actinomycetota bacterium]|nr:VIT1/CCC1 transporter family protein [Actinomycetota bacterium]